jgi:hypothetical protein
MDIKNGIGWIALGKNGLLPGEGADLFAIARVRKERFAIELDAPMVRSPVGHGFLSELRMGCRLRALHQARARSFRTFGK